MINRETLAMMKSDAYLINLARGPHVDRDALEEALNNGVIAGAALDVIEYELDVEKGDFSHPLFSNPKVIFTPHTGWYSTGSNRKARTVAAQEIVDYINENLSNYNDARRSSNILIKVDSDASDEDKAAAKAKAQECLDKINSGELSFEDAVEQYSEDTGSKEKKGDVGWDKLTTFVDSYQTALEGLNKGDVSEVVESTYGYHVIKCTDYFHVDNQVDDINQVPKAIKKYVSNVVKTQAASTAYSEWLEQYKKDADITVNPMPKDVPYNVSLKGVTKSSTDDSSTTE